MGHGSTSAQMAGSARFKMATNASFCARLPSIDRELASVLVTDRALQASNLRPRARWRAISAGPGSR
jgi:hypothetical protein